MPPSPARYSAKLSSGELTGLDFAAPCVFGKAGLIDAREKREGDQASPIGIWPVRRALCRFDRIKPPATALRLDPITSDDGWCDDPSDAGYNRQIRIPYPARHETLKRSDQLYDLIVILGHNDDPPETGLGSAIFLHCQNHKGEPTLGCLALPRERLIELVSRLNPGDEIEITP